MPSAFCYAATSETAIAIEESKMEAVMFAQWEGWIGGGVGVLAGVLGGAFGTYCAIRNTVSPRERSFAIKASVICWVFVLAFAAGMILIPGLYKHLLWIPYTVVLIWGINTFNRTQARIRMEESGKGP
jgi:hypothetical protein